MFRDTTEEHTHTHSEGHYKTDKRENVEEIRRAMQMPGDTMRPIDREHRPQIVCARYVPLQFASSSSTVFEQYCRLPVISAT